MEVERPELGLTDAHCISQHGLKHRLKLARRSADDLQHLGRSRLLLQRLGKVPPRLGEFTGAHFELPFQLDQ